MASDLVQAVASRFIQASELIEVKEVEGRVEVSGPYSKMQKLIPYLRGKLEYRGRDHTWWVPKAKMTPLKIKNLQKKVDEINGPASQEPKKVEESEEDKASRLDAAKQLFHRAIGMRVPGLSFALISGNGIQLTGVLTDLRVSINRAGGDYGPEFSKFYPHSVKPVEFEKLLDEVEDQGRLLAKSLADLSSILPRKFPNLKIDVGTNNGSYLFVVSGKTFDFKDEIKRRVPVTFNGRGSYWWAPIQKVKDDQVKELISYLEGEERARAEKWKIEQKPPEAERRRPNQKGDHCLNCGGWVGAGEGYLVNYYDSEPGDFVWKVEHKDKEDCAKVKAEVRIQSELARTKGEARRNLMLMCQKSEYYVEGTDHRPPGEQIWIDKTSLGYGGGTWVVIEPGENYFWYVKNNGADGDDWSRNNVLTGGAGAIGYRLPMTDEARVLIDVAKDS